MVKMLLENQSPSGRVIFLFPSLRLSLPLLPLGCCVRFCCLALLLLNIIEADNFIPQFCFFYFKDLKIECLQESQELNLQKLRNSELILNEAKQKMRELTINIKMKEDLIKELMKTGNNIL